MTRRCRRREHLQIVDLLAIERGIVALSESDLVNPDRIAEVGAALRGLLVQTRLSPADILAVSIFTGRGVTALEAWLLEAARIMPVRHATGRFRPAVDRSFFARHRHDCHRYGVRRQGSRRR